MNLGKQILESIQRGINLAIDDIEDVSMEYQKKSKIENNIHTRDLIGWVDLGLPSGILWAKYNVGVNPACLKKADDWYGGFYAWGEVETKDFYTWETYKYANNYSDALTKYCPKNGHNYWNGNGEPDDLITLEPMDDVAIKQNSNSRMPTWQELAELCELENKWESNYNDVPGLNGRIFIGKNGNTLFIPAAGYKNVLHEKKGESCHLWASTIDKLNPMWAYYMLFNKHTDAFTYYTTKNYGYSVRAVLNM